MKKFSLSLSLFYVLSYVFAPAACGNFLNERYRGWYWFEEKNSRAEREESTAVLKKAEDNARARQEVENFAAELEEKRYAMFAAPTLENVRTYRAAELEMWRRGMNLAQNWVLANLRYPELFDRTEQPINVQGARLKREIEHKETTRAIEKTARNFDLVFFSREDCPYCRAFAPIIKKFAENYGFNIEEVASGTSSGLFKTARAPHLADKLGIKAYPALVAVAKDASTAFEIARGMLSFSELEEYIALIPKLIRSGSR